MEYDELGAYGIDRRHPALYHLRISDLPIRSLKDRFWQLLYTLEREIPKCGHAKIIKHIKIIENCAHKR